VRTVGIEKGHESFCPPDNIAQATNHVASRIWELERLVAASANALPRTIASLRLRQLCPPLPGGQRSRHPRVLRPPTVRTGRRPRLGEDRLGRSARRLPRGTCEFRP
jgi:hypothetical protein